MKKEKQVEEVNESRERSGKDAFIGEFFVCADSDAAARSGPTAGTLADRRSRSRSVCRGIAVGSMSAVRSVGSLWSSEQERPARAGRRSCRRAERVVRAGRSVRRTR